MVSYIKTLDHGLKRSRPIKQIVIHAMAEYVKYPDDNILDAWSCLEAEALSVHYMVTPSGVILNCTPESHIAWHCRGYNTTSIGIEFLVPGVYTYREFEEEIKYPYILYSQKSAGYKLLQDLQNRYPEAKLFRHSDLDPERKVDPGEGFPWAELTWRLE